jgi:hypothetical protein
VKRLTLFLVIVTLLCLAATASADQIVVKKNFWGGWRYSTDSVTFQGVGASGDKIKELLADDSTGLSEMKSFASSSGLSIATGIPGGVLVGWPLGTLIAGRDWTDTNTLMLAIGAPLCVMSTVFDMKAGSHLKKAVARYNERHGSGAEKPTASVFPVMFDGKSMGVGLVIRF